MVPGGPYSSATAMTFAGPQRRCWTPSTWRPYERHLASPSPFSRRLCVAAVTTAFVIGILVGILLPLYVPSSSALALLPDSGSNASETNAIIAHGPWDAQSDPPKPSPKPSTSQDGIKATRSQSGASLNRVRGGPDTPYRPMAKDPAPLKPSLTDLWHRTSGQQPRKTIPVSDPSINATQITRPKQWQASGQEEDPLQDVSMEDLVDGVYWSDRVEGALPRGFSPAEVASWTSFAANATVVKVAEGCGRMQNRLLVFDSGSRSCCRYRQNNDQIQGEIFSFYLAQLLGLRSLPPAALGLVHGHEGQWRTVRGQLTLAQWNEQKPVVMTRFVDDLVPAHIPRHFRGAGSGQRRLHPVPQDLGGLASSALRELAQWSDLVVFDYLTANLDRVVNNMYNKQWNPDMMSAPAHNLAKVAKTGLLVFLDNESGLLHGYRLLDKYESYHVAMLEGLCLFRRATAKAVLELHQAGDVGQRLKMALLRAQPQMAEWLPLLPDKSVKILRERLARVARQILQCEQMYANPSSTLDSNLVGSREDLRDSLIRPNVESS